MTLPLASKLLYAILLYWISCDLVISRMHVRLGRPHVLVVYKNNVFCSCWCINLQGLGTGACCEVANKLNKVSTPLFCNMVGGG